MAEFYSVEVRFKDGTSGKARGIGNNAAWLRCGEVPAVLLHLLHAHRQLTDTLAAKKLTEALAPE